MKIIKKENNNIFTSILQYLNVKFTHEYANKLYNEHPYKNNMFGLSMMLSNYGIDNTGIKIEDKENIAQIPTPFIAHLNNEFVTVYKIDNQNIHYTTGETDITIDNERFCKIWTGAALIPEISFNTQEPNYKFNSRVQLFHKLQYVFCIALLTISTTLIYISKGIYNNVGITIMTCINIAGIFISYLLILKQLYIQSKYVDKVCTLFKKGDCNNILESHAAKFLGVISWSEVGFCYFFANTIILLIFPELIPYYVFINICALPYSLWSIWYQKYRANQWCPLCLCIQLLLWTIFIGNILLGWFISPELTIYNILTIIITYIFPFLLLDTIIPIIEKKRQSIHIKQEMNSIKMKDEIFSTILKQQTYYNIDKNTSQILFGNRESKILISILTNPHCEPCAAMHQKIHNLLHEVGDKICVQYIFSSFNNELETSSKFLIAIYQNKSIEETLNIYNEWYHKKKYEKENVFKQYSLNLQTTEVTTENEKHYSWKEKNKLYNTPTVLFNGYYYPTLYQIEDIKYFTNLEVDIQ